MTPYYRNKIFKIFPFLITLALTVMACSSASPPPVQTTSEEMATPTVAQISSTSTLSPSEPVPLHSQITVDDVALSISDVLFPADEVVREGHKLNPTPDPSTHYIFVTITATCQKDPYDCPLGPVRIVDSSDEEHYPILGLEGVPCEAPSGKFHSGDTRNICLIYLVPGADAGLTLKYESFWGELAYFAIQ